jgi:WhiB family transcriptional regulator, redox-sensing transcriptional regulator
MQDEGWPLRAACRGEDVELFYSTAETDVGRALTFCARCDVREACLRAALSRGETFGTWGGLTEAELRRILRRERRERTAA